METVEVEAGKTVAVTSQGHITVAKGGDTIALPKFFAAQLKNDGIAKEPTPEEPEEPEGD